MDPSAAVSTLHLADPQGLWYFCAASSMPRVQGTGSGSHRLEHTAPLCSHRTNRWMDALFRMSLQCGSRGKSTCPGTSVQCGWLCWGSSGCLGMRQAAKYQVTQPARAHVIHLALLILQWLGTASHELSCGCVVLYQLTDKC